MPLDTSIELLISQYRGSENVERVLQIWLDITQKEIYDAVAELQRQVVLDTSEGVWLDRIGNREGLPRPWARDPDAVFGFDDSGVGFDVGVMFDVETPDPLAPIGDPLYRALIKARGWMLLGFGTLDVMERAVRELDAHATVLELNQPVSVTGTFT